MRWKCCPWWAWIYCMCSTFHEFIWLSTKCYTHSEEDVGSAGNRGRSHEAMLIDKGKGHDHTEHTGHASNEHASPSDKTDSQNNREDMTALLRSWRNSKLKYLNSRTMAHTFKCENHLWYLMLIDNSRDQERNQQIYFMCVIHHSLCLIWKKLIIGCEELHLYIGSSIHWLKYWVAIGVTAPPKRK